MKIFLLIVFHWSHIYYCSNLSGFNLYHTDHLLNDLDRDCLYYYVSKEKYYIPTPDHYVPKTALIHQIIEYCIRFELDEKLPNDIDHRHSFTFEDLRKKSITSDQLYEWSAPVDLIEHYHIYLENNSSPDTFVFYNCTYPWFGSHCEYTFDQLQSSFAEQVERSFSKDMYESNFPNTLPCYTYLECDRVGDYGKTPGACLDWREVCDGKVDCLDGGRDEEQCWQLEINECDSEREFRCHNGLCIPLAFLHDDSKNPDCLDRTDDYVVGSESIYSILPFENHCYMNPGFQCEEHMCRPDRRNRYMIECGDGSCGSLVSRSCRNHRTKILRSAFLVGTHISEQCRQAIGCLTGLAQIDLRFPVVCNISFLFTYMKLTREHCPIQIEFPSILFGHVRFIYNNDQSRVSKGSLNMIIII